MKMISLAAIPLSIRCGHLRLRPVRVTDGRLLKAVLTGEEVWSAGGPPGPVSVSRVSAWWWAGKTFRPAYCIETFSEVIGFIGLYDLRIGKSAEITLIIPDKERRRLGYGTASFELLAQSLRQCKAVEGLTVRVNGGNAAAVSFWEKLGFKEGPSAGGVKVMSLDLQSQGWNRPGHPPAVGPVKLARSD